MCDSTNIFDPGTAGGEQPLRAPLEKLIGSGGNHFVVVGAAHLVGGDSIITMLRSRGYAIERY